MRFAAMGLGLLSLAAAGCGTKSGTKTCTLIGCTDQATIGIQRANGAGVSLSVSLDIDGRIVECPAPPANAGAPCDGQVRVTQRELQECFEEMVGSAIFLRCAGTGKFEQVVEISGTPTTIRVTARNATMVVAESSFTPQYMDVQPNGPDCEPTCKQWGQTWILP